MWESTSEFPAPWEEMECNFLSRPLIPEQREFSRLGFSWHRRTGFGVFGIFPAAQDEPELAPGCPGHYGFVE